MLSVSKRRLVCVFALMMSCTLGVAELRADPLTFNGTFFSIDSAGNRVDLFSNPGAVLEPSTYGGTIIPAAMLFGAFVNFEGGASVTDTIRFTYQEAGAAPLLYSQTLTTGTEPIDLGFVARFEPVHHTGNLVPTTLTVELLSSSPDFVIPSGPLAGQPVDSYTYSFLTQTTVQPVPEPSTWMLILSGGIAALFPRARRGLRASTASVLLRRCAWARRLRRHPGRRAHRALRGKWPRPAVQLPSRDV